MNIVYSSYMSYIDEDDRRAPQTRVRLPAPVNTRMKFKLQRQKEEFEYKPEPRQFSFYQICQFPMDKQYSVRKIIYDETGEIVNYRESKLKKSVLEKFLKSCPECKYTIYPAYDLGVVGFPVSDEILVAQSHILNGY